MMACQRLLRLQNVNFLRLSSETLSRLTVCPCARSRTLSFARSYGASMRAWVINQYGANDVLTFTEHHPMPSVQYAHEVVVQVHAVSLNPLDVSMRGGYGAGVLRLRRDPRSVLQSGAEFPLVLGRDVSGVVLECGSGVTHVQEGDEVWASIPPWQQGSLAECVLLNGSDVSLKPKSLSHIEAASIPYVASTAWSALVNTGGLHSDNCSKKRILVHGASGGVGTFSVQLLKAWGCHVTATCFQDGFGLVKALGADDVIDCTAADASSQLRTRQKFDLILDNVGGDTESWAIDLLKPWAGSKFVTLVSPLLRNTDSLGLVDGVLKSGMMLHDKAIRSVVKGVFYRWAFYVPDGVALDRIGELVASGKIRPVVEVTFPFSQVPEAFQKVETGQARGKTVIAVTTDEAASSSSTHTHSDAGTPAFWTHTDTHTPRAGGHVASCAAEEEAHFAKTHTESPAASTAGPSPPNPQEEVQPWALREAAGEAQGETTASPEESNGRKPQAQLQSQPQSQSQSQSQSAHSSAVEGAQATEMQTASLEAMQMTEAASLEGMQTTETASVEGTQTTEAASVEAMQTTEAASVEGTQATEAASVEGMQTTDTAKVEGMQTIETVSVEGIQMTEAASVEAMQTTDTASAEGMQTTEAASVEAMQTTEAASVEGTQTTEAASVEAMQTTDTASVEGMQTSEAASIEGMQMTEAASVEAMQTTEAASVEGTQMTGPAEGTQVTETQTASVEVTQAIETASLEGTQTTETADGTTQAGSTQATDSRPAS